MNHVYFDKGGFRSKSRTLAEAPEKDKTITVGDINEFVRTHVEQKESRQDKTVLWLPILLLNLRWVRFFFQRFERTKA